MLKANAQLVPIRSVEIVSTNSSYVNSDPGAWKVTKSAEWTAVGKARITLNVESVRKIDGNTKYDLVLVIDNSGSMSGQKIDRVISDASDLVNSLLSDTANRVALVTFDTEASIRTGFSNDRSELLSIINSISPGSCTNYLDGLTKAESVLDGYTQQEGRELILLFLTDGYPNIDTPNEKAQYRTLKAEYPYMTINGIQYEMGEDILQPIIDISDYQFIANMDTLNNVLFEASVVPYTYDEFIVTDYIDDTYWTLVDQNAIETSLGTTSISYDGATPIVTWDMSNKLRSGQTATLTIDINLKPEYFDLSNLMLPTNKHEVINTKIPEVPDENIDSPNTPVLKDAYDVIYDSNLPEGCILSGTVPNTSSHTIFTTVEIENNVLSCNGYIFKGWSFYTVGVQRINDDYFRMPSHDVTLRAIWSRPNISKSMDGLAHVRATATFDYNLDTKIKRLSGQANPSSTSENNTTITAFRRSDTLPSTLDTNDSQFILSANSSQVPIYGWFDNGIIYYYTDAETVILNSAYKLFA